MLSYSNLITQLSTMTLGLELPFRMMRLRYIEAMPIACLPSRANLQTVTANQPGNHRKRRDHEKVN